MCAFVPVMAAVAVASVATSVAGTVVQAKGAKRAAAAQAGMYGASAAQDEQNKKFADQAAREAERQGEKDVAQVKAEGVQLHSAQKVAYAGSGIDSGTGTAVDVQSGSEMLNEMDVQNVRRNAALNARGYRQQGLNFQAQAGVSRAAGREAIAQGKQAVTGSILGGIGSAVGAASNFFGQVYGRRGGSLL